MDVIKILEKLVSFNTIEDKQNTEIIDWIIQYLVEYGFKFKIISEKNTKRKCLIAQLGKNPILAFCGHLDTINATEGWENSPFKIKIDEDKIFGLGVCDMKGGIAAILKACSNIDENKLKRDLKIYFTFDEEINFRGINLLLKNEKKFPEYLILAEPTDLKPVVATKGCMEMKVTIYGKATHSSTPNKGKSAILEAHKFIEELLEFGEKLKEEKNDMFSIPYTTLNIGIINGGDAINKVPDKCIIKFDARTINKKHNILIEERMKQILKKYNYKFEIGLNIHANINTDHKMIQTIENLTGHKRKAENYVTEASFIENSKAVILGVGPITAHQCNEYIEAPKLNELVKIYSKIIETYCS